MPLICSFAQTAQTTGVCTNHFQMEQWWAKPVQLSNTDPHCLEEFHLVNSLGIEAVTLCHKAFRQFLSWLSDPSTENDFRVTEIKFYNLLLDSVLRK